MKKVLIVLLLTMCVTTASAQVAKYRATDFACKYETANGYWSEWSDWQACSMLIVLNLNNSTVQIYSQELQEFDIIEQVSGWRNDGSGGQSMEVSCVDRNGLRCHMRFRRQNDGQLQLYVDYRDFMYVYAIEVRE